MELVFNGHTQEEKEREKERVSIENIPNNDISLKNLNVEMDNSKILNSVNLEIPSGSCIHIGGASGAGKTTLMKVISGYYKPSSGECRFGGVPIENIKKSGDDSFYSRIAYLSQFPYLVEDSVRNNLKFGIKSEINDVQIREVLKEIGLSKRFNDLDERLFFGSGDSGTISGGETSRLALARVLLKIRNNDTKIVFLDEPTASVDKKTKESIAEVIIKERSKRPDISFIVISHDEQFVEMLNCDIKVEMDNGKIIDKNIES